VRKSVTFQHNDSATEIETQMATTPTHEDPLKMPVQFVRGVGPERSRLLANLGIVAVEDLLWNMPRDVLDLTNVTPAQRLQTGVLQTVRGQVVDLDGRTTGTGRNLVAVLLDSDGLYVRGLWFNQPWMIHKFRGGEWVLFSGKPKRSQGRWEYSNPRVQWIGDEDAATTASGGLIPRYSLTEGLSMDQMGRIVRAAVEAYADLIPDPLPAGLRERLDLPVLKEAVRGMHLPKSIEEYEKSRRRLIFDDLFEFQLGLALRRRSWKTRGAAPVLPTTAKIDSRIRRLFPFAFTEGQSKAVREISEDLASGHAMHRLLQADVGAGKTAVAVYAILVTVAAGYQAVIMAPTEVLANQHWATIDAALAHSRVHRLLLTGGLATRERRQALTEIADGTVQLVVGTQAVIQKDVNFAKLGLVVIDEQHKFGVLQRAMFSKGDLSPHVLVMTATPIPRSLCLTQFGDLDLTIISDMPPGRQRVITSRVTNADMRQRAWDFVKQQLKKGRQAFVICPRIEATDADLSKGPAASAEEVFKLLSAGELRDFKVGLVHGQVESERKSAVMESFRQGRIDVLVSTTVVEVGVDVPNATMMIIDEAHRFGLSQLHQLRGRVSRGKFQGYCFLFSGADAPEALRRLTALETMSDGFQIAEADFEIRGPGDVLGTRQHGDLPLRVADLIRDAAILKEARTCAFDLVKTAEFDRPDYAMLKVKVLERFGAALDLPKTG
jgi:ATP-dependent DNA helicase RecG